MQPRPPLCRHVVVRRPPHGDVTVGTVLGNVELVGTEHVGPTTGGQIPKTAWSIRLPYLRPHTGEEKVFPGQGRRVSVLFQIGLAAPKWLEVHRPDRAAQRTII